MSEDATREGVQDEAVNTPAEKTENLSPREQAMEQLHANRIAELKTQIDDPAAFGGQEATPAATDEPANEPSGETDRQDDQIAAQISADEPSKTMVKVKIDGKEQEVPLSRVIADYQKNGSADQRLAEATQLLREAKEAREAAATPQARANAQEQVDQASQSVDQIKAKRSEFLQAIFSGDEETAARLFDEAIGGGNSKKDEGRDIATPDLVQAVAKQVKQQTDVESALAQTKKDYPLIFQDEDFQEVAATKVERKVRDEGIPFHEALAVVAEDMAKKFGWEKQGRPAGDVLPTTDKRAERLERKKAGDNNLPAANMRAGNNTAPELPMDERSRANRALDSLRAGRPAANF